MVFSSAGRAVAAADAWGRGARVLRAGLAIVIISKKVAI
jgi:hypothetical protein